MSKKIINLKVCAVIYEWRLDWPFVREAVLTIRQNKMAV